MELEKLKLREINILKQEDAKENLLLNRNDQFAQKANIIKKYLI